MRGWLLILLWITGFGGGKIPHVRNSVRVVTGITVTAVEETQMYTTHYTDSQTMETILNYLRTLDPYTKTALAPESFRTDIYEIIVSYSDQKNTVYRQIYNQYLQIPDGSWRRIDPQDGSKLLDILNKLYQI